MNLLKFCVPKQMMGEICWQTHKHMIAGGFENRAVWEGTFLSSQLVRWGVVVKQLFLSENSTIFLFHSHTCFSRASIFPHKTEWKVLLRREPLPEKYEQATSSWGWTSPPPGKYTEPGRGHLQTYWPEDPFYAVVETVINFWDMGAVLLKMVLVNIKTH